MARAPKQTTPSAGRSTGRPRKTAAARPQRRRQVPAETAAETPATTPAATVEAVKAAAEPAATAPAPEAATEAMADQARRAVEAAALQVEAASRAVTATQEAVETVGRRADRESREIAETAYRTSRARLEDTVAGVQGRLLAGVDGGAGLGAAVLRSGGAAIDGYGRAAVRFFAFAEAAREMSFGLARDLAGARTPADLAEIHGRHAAAGLRLVVDEIEGTAGLSFETVEAIAEPLLERTAVLVSDFGFGPRG